MNDILTGTNSGEEVLEYQSQLINLCGQFKLRKWDSNSNLILQTVPTKAQAISPFCFINSIDQLELKILGLRWNSKNDTFSFDTTPSLNNPSKHSVLSDITCVFDPLGLLSPVMF